MALQDTRAVLKSFEGKPIAEEFAAREALARQRFEAQLAEEKAKRPKRSAASLFGGILGIKNVATDIHGAPSHGEGFEQGKMLLDQIREAGQKQYEFIEKEIRENGDKYLEERAAENEKAQNEQVKEMKKNLTGWLELWGKKGGE
jgi:import inner membrane translocase subunit TIM50